MRRKREKKSRLSVESKGMMGDYLSTQKEHFQAAPQGKPRHCTLPHTTWCGGRMTMARAMGRRCWEGERCHWQSGGAREEGMYRSCGADVRVPGKRCGGAGG